MKIKLLQKFADFIVNQILNAKTIKEVKFWFNIGMIINARLIEKNIYLN